MKNRKTSGTSEVKAKKAKEENKKIYMYPFGPMHDRTPFDPAGLPIKGIAQRDWFELDGRAQNLAKFCLPLLMANSAGYLLTSPVHFKITWDGDEAHPTKIEILDRLSHGRVDDHSTFGGFTVQSSSVFETKNEGDYIWIKQLPNMRRPWFSAMEGLMEAWWGSGGATLGLVCLLNRPGTFEMKIGDPIAQMVLVNKKDLESDLVYEPKTIKESYEWNNRRNRKEYGKTGPDLDYFKGIWPDGVKVPVHLSNWKKSKIYNGDVEDDDRKRRKPSI